MRQLICESHVEEAALEWFEGLNWPVLHGPDIAPDELLSERESYSDVILRERLEAAIDSLNPNFPTEAKEEALRKVLHVDSPSLILRNRAFHKLLTDGVTVEVAENGEVRGEQVKLIDFQNPDTNDWLVVNQFTVVDLSARGAQAGSQHNRRPDIVVFVNGLPLAVIELKNPADENATIESARKQFETYKAEIPSLFNTNELLIASDGDQARMGSLTAGREWYLPWKTVDGKTIAVPDDLELETLIKGVFDKRRFLDLIRHFIVFEDLDGEIIKKVAAYHQFHATRTAVDTVVAASQPGGGKQGGVVWHTQGAGKSLTMVFCAGKLVLHPEMRNPTILVITDRNDLDDQLFGTFARCSELVRQKPVQAENRTHLRKLLNVASGGVVFSTIQKFFPEEKGDTHPCLTERDNVVVIADEAHRSQYDFIDGFARHIRDALPSATFIGFTGTPIELSDRNTYAVFGDTISVYDIKQAVADKATVPIYYESRIANLDLPEDQLPQVDVELEEVTENEEIERVEKLKSKWAALEIIVGTEKRLELVADDLLQHFDDRQSAMDGKAMIVGMSRRICVAIYDQIVKRHPEWADDDDEKGAVKVVMSGSASDPVKWQDHIRNKQRRDRLSKRFKDPDDPLKLVIVRDMWLTGFDVPCLHTMYIDKPMKGHTLMQAIARVNRVFRDKPGGLIVDYIGLADSLRKALANYTEGGGRGEIQYDQGQAVALMLEKLEICRDIFNDFEYKAYFGLDPADKMRFARRAMNYVLGLDDAKDEFIRAVVGLSQAFALAVPRPEAIAVRDEVAFFQYVKASIVKNTQTSQRPEEELSAAVRQIVDKAIAPDRVIDILDAVGIDKPDISILSDTFLAEVRGMEQRNLAVEVLRKLLNDEIKLRRKTNLIQSRHFSEMLQATLHRYKNRAIETMQVIEELIKLAKEMREANQRGEKLGLTTEELAFYDALETNDSAVAVLGDEILSELARDLADTVRKSAKIDWTMKESIRAEMRVLVKRTLRKYDYPPDKQKKATETIIQQAELIGEEWAG
jgi:type I restriction enzyme R subunit